MEEFNEYLKHNASPILDEFDLADNEREEKKLKNEGEFIVDMINHSGEIPKQKRCIWCGATEDLRSITIKEDKDDIGYKDYVCECCYEMSEKERDD